MEPDRYLWISESTAELEMLKEFTVEEESAGTEFGLAASYTLVDDELLE